MFLGQDICHLITAPTLPALPPSFLMQPHQSESPSGGAASFHGTKGTLGNKVECLGCGGINPDRGLAVSLNESQNLGLKQLSVAEAEEAQSLAFCQQAPDKLYTGLLARQLYGLTAVAIYKYTSNRWMNVTAESATQWKTV